MVENRDSDVGYLGSRSAAQRTGGRDAGTEKRKREREEEMCVLESERAICLCWCWGVNDYC